MLHFRKVYEVVGYVYEADYHCLECAEARFGQAALEAGTAVDREGNPVGVLFLGDCDGPESCGDCLEALDV